MSTSLINIRRDVNDPFYRYKMPKIISKIEGKGNGIKTVIPNMSDIAKALHRPPSYPTKFFGCELGTMCKIDDSKDRYIVNGAHDAAKLQVILDGFISKFVLCSECLNPETDLVIAKDLSISRECKACGKVTRVDMLHKLCTFIIKNPPGDLAGARYKKDKQQDQQEGGDEGDSGDQEDDSFDPNAAAIELKHVSESQLDDWSVDVSSEAVAARMKKMEITEKTRKLNAEMNEDDFEGGFENVKLEQFAQFIDSNKCEIDNGEFDLVFSKLDELSIRKDKAVAVLTQTLFSRDILKQLEKYQTLFMRMVKNEKGQKAFLGGIERLIGVLFPDELMAKTPVILKAAYDLDLLEEEVLLAWSKKLSKKYVDKEIAKQLRKRAEPFITWLETAEEESEDDDEDSD